MENGVQFYSLLVSALDGGKSLFLNLCEADHNGRAVFRRGSAAVRVWDCWFETCRMH
jgi:hypothetical protein